MDGVEGEESRTAYGKHPEIAQVPKSHDAERIYAHGNGRSWL